MDIEFQNGMKLSVPLKDKMNAKEASMLLSQTLQSIQKIQSMNVAYEKFDVPRKATIKNSSYIPSKQITKKPRLDTLQNVELVKQMRSEGKSDKQISKELGKNFTFVTSLVQRGLIEPNQNTAQKITRIKGHEPTPFTDEVKNRIRQMRQNGMNDKQISLALGYTENWVSNKIIRGLIEHHPTADTNRLIARGIKTGDEQNGNNDNYQEA